MILKRERERERKREGGEREREREGKYFTYNINVAISQQLYYFTPALPHEQMFAWSVELHYIMSVKCHRQC